MAEYTYTCSCGRKLLVGDKCHENLIKDRTERLLTMTECCIYCGAELPKQHEAREGNWWLNHDWRKEREYHAEDCEWVLTRAHTQPLPIEPDWTEGHDCPAGNIED